MKYVCALIAVSDMENSKRFYRDTLGLDVVEDFGANVTLEGGIALQTLDSWKKFIQMDNVVLPSNSGELYFEEDDLDGFCARLKTRDIRYVPAGTQLGPTGRPFLRPGRAHYRSRRKH